MKAVGPRLKAVRQRTVPPLSIRAAAEALGIPSSSYNFYESPNTFKKSALPIEFARKVAAVFEQRGVPAAEVMALAGLVDEEAAAEAKAIEAARPPISFVTMQVALPSAEALAEMFEALLAPLDMSQPKAELSALLARRLPVGLAQLAGPLRFEASDEEPVDVAIPPPRASSGRAPQPAPRT